MKKRAALALAIGMAMAGNMVSYAAVAGDADTDAASSAISISGASGTQNSVLKGTIKVTNIRVQVPTAAGFEINPNATTTATAVSQIELQSTNYKIKNLSTVDLDVSITDVALAATSGTAPTLVNTVAGLSGDRKVMFAIRDTAEASGAAPVEADTAKWIMSPTTSAPYYVNGSAASTLAPNGELEMKLYGATTTGWANNDTFTVTPTFTIAVH